METAARSELRALMEELCEPGKQSGGHCLGAGGESLWSTAIVENGPI